MDMTGPTPFDGVDVGMFIEAHRDTHAWFVSLKHFPITLLGREISKYNELARGLLGGD